LFLYTSFAGLQSAAVYSEVLIAVKVAASHSCELLWLRSLHI